VSKEALWNFIKKQFLLILIALAIIVYTLLFKPDPPIRVNWNKVTPGKGDAVLSVIVPEEVNGVGKKFRADIMLDTNKNFINAVKSYIEFDPRVLKIESIDTSKSFCKFYPENSHSNEKGIIKLQCGTPYPGFRGINTIQTIYFTSQAIRVTDIKVSDESLILANDGKGTNLIKDYPTVSIRIKAGL
jgi:hypothetical protein